MAGLPVPLPTLRRSPRGLLRTAQVRSDLLGPHRGGLAPPTLCRSPGALVTQPYQDSRWPPQPRGLRPRRPYGSRAKSSDPKIRPEGPRTPRDGTSAVFPLSQSMSSVCRSVSSFGFDWSASLLNTLPDECI